MDGEMRILGSDTMYCACCKKRTKHLKVLVNGVILFLCDELHGVERQTDLATKVQTGHAHDAGCFPERR